MGPKYEDRGTKDWDGLTPEEQAFHEREMDRADRGLDVEFPFARPVSLEAAREYLAQCVLQHGERYMPLYTRIEDEIEARKEKVSAVDKLRRFREARKF